MIQRLKDQLSEDLKKNSKTDWKILAIILIILLSAFIPWKTVVATDLVFNFSAPQNAKEWQIGYDVHKLVRAIGLHETKGCTIGSGATHNNPGGVMTWHRGFREFKYYNSCDEGYNDMARIWSTYYKAFPNLALAKKYSGNDRPDAWLSNVTHFYKQI